MTDSSSPEAVLAGLPASLRVSLLAAARQATDTLGRTGVPTSLRPYIGFTPAALGDGNALRALNQALVSDARLRDAVGKALPKDLWTAAGAEESDVLVTRFGAADAAAALAARGRWADLEAVAALAPPPPRKGAAAVADSPAAPEPPRKAEITAARRERAQAQRRADAAEQRAAQAEAQLREVRQALAEAEAALARLTRDHETERTRWRDRLARLQRRTSESEAQARASHARSTALAEELRDIATRLVSAPDDDAPGDTDGTTPPAPSPATVPRSVTAATPGRPCVLPPGIAGDSPAAVTALLAVPGIDVVVDGYNVTKDIRGVPTAQLAQQRAWLERLVAGVAAARGLRITVVFDGDGDRTHAAAPARVVRVVYTAAGESADDRIVAIVGALDPAAPVVVVTSDGEVRDACEALAANVVASGVFLKAVG